MTTVLARFVTALLVLGVHASTFGADQPIAATRLTLKRGSTSAKLVFVTKDPAFLFPAMASADDPSLAGATIDLFAIGEGAASLAIPPGVGKPGWLLTTAAPSYRFTNRTAPAGPSPVRTAQLKQHRQLRIVARAVPLPLAVAEGAIGIRVTTGTLRSCALFDAATVRVDVPGRFVAAGALATSLADCSDTALGAPTTTSTTATTTTTTTVPVCGDGVVQAGEECDDPAPGPCFGSCGAPGTPTACQCCVQNGGQCGSGGGAAPCCDPAAACAPVCAPMFPSYCTVPPPPFPGCNMSGTWDFFDSPTSTFYSIVEGAGGALSVVVYTYPDFATYQVGTGTRTGDAIHISLPSGPIDLVQQSCTVASGGLCNDFVRGTTSVCGDGTIDTEPGLEEQCDDGNQIAGDCCSPTCRVEPGCP
jgi:cysteine-rich repeat protein